MNAKPEQSRALPVPANRFTRLGKLGSMTAGIAGNMAVNGLTQFGKGQRPSMRDLLLTPRNINRVAEQLAQMRGAAMKIGQLMSMDTGEVLPPELAQIMARLRDDAHFMPPAQLKQVLNAHWPEGWLRRFASFNVRPIAAASIGQVHRAQLKDGRDVAVKVQYPGVAKSIDSDVANVGALMRMSGLLPRGFELAPYLEEARKQLHEETDYLREGTQMAQFASLLAEDPDFLVPGLHADFSTPEILTMSFIDGVSIEEAANAPRETRDRIAERLIDLTLKELFVFGQMQTDPNFANYLIKPETGQIVLLDFGAARRIAPEIIDQYDRLLRAGLADDVTTLNALVVEIGFVSPETCEQHHAAVVEIIRVVFAILRADTPFDFVNNTLSEDMQLRGTALAESGFVPPPLPIDILLLQRKLSGVFLLAKRLGARVDVVALIDKHLQNRR